LKNNRYRPGRIENEIEFDYVEPDTKEPQKPKPNEGLQDNLRRA